MRDYLLFVRQNLALLTFGFMTVFTGNLGQSFFIAWFGAGIQEIIWSVFTATHGQYDHESLFP